MLTKSERCRIVKEVAAVGEVYRDVYLRETANAYPNRKRDWIAALGFFLRGYAFERSGRSPVYSYVACKALKAVAGSQDAPSREFASELWKKFCEIGRFEEGKGANPRNNPLYPDSTGPHVTVCLASPRDHGQNIYRFALTQLRQKQTLSIHAALVKIRGIGPKIASYFLRDVALDAGIGYGSITYPDRLQPIDVWVRRLIEHLDPSSGSRLARAARSLSEDAGVSPLLFNAGAWQFGAKIAGNQIALEDACRDYGKFSSFLLQHSERIRREAEAFSKVLK